MAYPSSNARQRCWPVVPARIFLEGLQSVGVVANRIPAFEDLSEILTKATGWSIVAVPGLVPDEVFFEHMANCRFPVTWWIRKPEQMDYLKEPDVFHDIYGHVPLLMNPEFGDYMQAYGRGGLKAKRMGEIAHLARLYWYTVEFGLIRDAVSGGLRIYGSGHPFVKVRISLQCGKPKSQPYRFRPASSNARQVPHRHVPKDLFCN